MPQTLTITRHAIRNCTDPVLQACATQTLIEAAGSSCTTIDYRQPGVGDTARGYRLRPPGPVGLVKDLTYRAFRARGARALEESLRSSSRSGCNLLPTVSTPTRRLRAIDGPRIQSTASAPTKSGTWRMQTLTTAHTTSLLHPGWQRGSALPPLSG